MKQSMTVDRPEVWTELEAYPLIDAGRGVAWRWR